MRAALALLAFLALLGAGLYAGHTAQQRVERALAAKCARASDGSAADVAACYHKHGVNP
jgi:hypothetical protein